MAPQNPLEDLPPECLDFLANLGLVDVGDISLANNNNKAKISNQNLGGFGKIFFLESIYFYNAVLFKN